MEKIFKTLLIVLLAISAVLVLWGVFATPDKPATAAEAPAIGYNLVWGYILLGAAVVVALFCAAMGLHPHHLCGYGGCRYRGYLFGCC